MPLCPPQNELDTSFDAGGKVNAGLTATTIVSQWTWVATIVYSSTVATKVSLGSLCNASDAQGRSPTLKGNHVE